MREGWFLAFCLQPCLSFKAFLSLPGPLLILSSVPRAVCAVSSPIVKSPK